MKIQIESDGTVFNTKVVDLDTGEEIRCSKIEIIFDAETGESRALLTIIPDELRLSVKNKNKELHCIVYNCINATEAIKN